MGWWEQLKNGLGNGHTAPDVERASAELVGRLESICERLEALVEYEEQRILDDDE